MKTNGYFVCVEKPQFVSPHTHKNRCTDIPTDGTRRLHHKPRRHSPANWFRPQLQPVPLRQSGRTHQKTNSGFIALYAGRVPPPELKIRGQLTRKTLGTPFSALCIIPQIKLTNKLILRCQSSCSSSPGALLATNLDNPIGHREPLSLASWVHRDSRSVGWNGGRPYHSLCGATMGLIYGPPQTVTGNGTGTTADKGQVIGRESGNTRHSRWGERKRKFLLLLPNNRSSSRTVTDSAIHAAAPPARLSVCLP